MDEAIEKLHAERAKLEEALYETILDFESRTGCVVRGFKVTRLYPHDLVTGVETEVHL